MSDHNTDEIRDLLAQAMSDAPDPHPWADVEQRVARDDAPPAARRRTGVWLVAAACTIALVGGLVAVVGSSADRTEPTEDPDDTTAPTPPSTSTTPSTSVPATTLPVAEAGWSGGLLDDIDTTSLRELASFAEGDVVVPTAPSGWRIADAQRTDPDAAVAPEFVEWTLEVIEARPDFNAFGHVLYLTQSAEPTCRTTLGCRPSGETTTINDVVWETIVVERIPDDDDEWFDETTLRAQVGDRWLSLAAGAPQALGGRRLLENPPIVEFLEGLRAGSPDTVTAVGEACWQCGVVGAEGDPFAAGSPGGTPATTPGSAPSAESEPSVVDPDAGRLLTELAEGDVVVPTYLPPGLQLRGGSKYDYQGGTSEFSVDLETADGEFSNSVRLWDNDRIVGPSGSRQFDDPNHPPIQIAGITWGWNDFETARVASVGSFEVWVYLHGLDRLEAERFIDGLRAVSIEEFPGPIVVDGADGLSVIDPDGSAGSEVVARDEQFELTAVRVGDQVCTKLEQTASPVTTTFGANCQPSTRLADSSILDFYSSDPTDTQHVIIGIIDSPGATDVRITSPQGQSVVVPTGPANQAVDGRFFLARLELDVSDGIRFDRFQIEDASP